MTNLTIKRVPALYLTIIGIAVAAAVVVLAARSSNEANAVTGTLDGSAGSVERFVIDADPNNTPANTLNLTGTGQLQGTVQECVEVAIGGTVQIDIVIDEVNSADKFTGGEVDVGFNGTIVQVTAYLLPVGAFDFTVGGSGGAAGAPTLPDNNGPFHPAWVSFNTPSDGELVLARLTFEGLTNGVSDITLSNPVANNKDVTPIPVNSTVGGRIAVGTGSCTATATPSPSPTPSPTPAPTPVPGTLTVNKTYTDLNTTAVTINVSCTGGTPDQAQKPASPGSPAIFTITLASATPASCTVTESNTPTGYAMVPDGSTCDDGPISVAPGASESCGFQNAPSTTTFTISKDFVPNNVASVSVSVACTGAGTLIAGSPSPYTTGSISEAASLVVTVTEFSGGDTCTVTETPVPTGYEKTGCVSVPLTQGTTACTVTNTTFATITVSKDFSDNSTQAVTMSVTCNGTGTVTAVDATAVDGGDDADFEVRGFTPNDTCDVTETSALSGYEKNESDCQGLVLSEPGAAVSCTMVNTLRTAGFTVFKDFSDNNSMNVTVSLTCSSGSVVANDNTASESDPADFTVNGFSVGATCTANETVPAGYTANTSDCVAVPVSVPNGTAGIAGFNGFLNNCTIVNTLNVAQFQVFKDFTNDATDDVETALVCTSGDVQEVDGTASESDPADYTITGFLAGATCTATETIPENYSADETDCVSVGIAHNQTSDCEIINTDVILFNVFKVWDPSETLFVTVIMTCTSGTVTTLDSSASESDPADFEIRGFTAGTTCTASEFVPAGWTADQSDCANIPPSQGSCIIINTLNETAPPSEPASETPTDEPTPVVTPPPTPVVTPTPTPTPGEDFVVWGNWNDCSNPGPPDPVDALLTLRDDAGLTTQTNDCPEMRETVQMVGGPVLTWGDLDCNGVPDPVDALKILRFDAGLSVVSTAGCPDVGDHIQIVH